MFNYLVQILLDIKFNLNISFRLSMNLSFISNLLFIPYKHRSFQKVGLVFLMDDLDLSTSYKVLQIQ